MEGKELYNEDEEFDPKSNKGLGDDDADDFGLPEIEDTYGQNDEIGDPFTDNLSDQPADNSFSDFDDSSSSYSADAPYSEPDYSYDEDQDTSDSDEGEYRSSYYDEDYQQKRSPVGWIVFGILFIIVVLAGGYWWFYLRDKEPEPPQQTTIVPPVTEIETPEPEPVVEEPEPEPTQQAGVYEINEATGRYHVIVASSIDKDLVRDYGNKLAKDGMVCNILAPRGNLKFHRLSVADFESVNEATIKSEELKNSMGADVWVIRY